MHMHITMVAECSHNRKSRCQRSPKGVDEHVHFRVRILIEHKVYIVGIKIPSTDISFEVKIIDERICLDIKKVS